MTEQELQFDALSPLLAALCDGTLDGDGFAQLERLLANDPAARGWYIAYMDLHGELCWDHRRSEGREERGEGRGLGTSVPSGADVAPLMLNDQSFATSVPHSSFLIHPLPATLPSPLSSLPSFLGSALFSYLLAAVILSTALAIAWAWKLPDTAQLAQHPLPPSAERRQEHAPQMTFVGRITGMVDCQWSDRTTAVPGPVAVPLGRKYALSSGLMEITYDTGAKVILQGPCTYEVESAAGGFLLVGKLTARVEKKGDTNSPRPSDGRGAGGEGSGNPNYPLSTIHYPLFAVRTPTAIVTDLGTEFGVEVSKEGNTTSHVFRGSVELRATSVAEGTKPAVCVLYADESAQVVTRVVSQESSAGEIRPIQVDARQFVRQLSREPSKKNALPMQVVAWFRLGEDDPGAVVGSNVAKETINHNGHYRLSPRTQPTYSANTAPGASTMSVSFGGAEDECLVNSHVPYCYWINEDFILEAWVFPRKLNKEGFQFVAYNGDPDKNGYGLCIGDGRWHFLLGGVQIVNSGVPCEVGKWTHLALVCRRDNPQLWVNGQPAGEPTAQRPMIPAMSFSIGCDHTTNPPFAFNGEIDEVRLSKFSGPFCPEMLLFQPSPPKGEKGDAAK